MSETDRVCVVTGVGPGTGLAVCRKFAAEGYHVAMFARSEERLTAWAAEIPGSIGVACDVADGGSVAAAFARVRDELGPVGVLVHNAGSGSFQTFMESSLEDLEASWRINTAGLFSCGQEAARDMLAGEGGSIVVTGATASLRGNVQTAAFAPAKAAQRSLAQSMARSLGPQGIHVALVIVDGVIDTPVTRSYLKEAADDFFLRPEAVADEIYHLAHQDPSAWTFELDLRPFGEKW